MIYLDNSATTKPDKSVVESYAKAARQYFANPSSIHKAGAGVEKLQSAARKQAAQLLGVQYEEVVFTSGGTEGNNIAIKGAAWQHQHRGIHIITTEVEHASVYETIQALEFFGFRVTILPVDHEGRVSVEAVKRAISDDTILVSIMHVNNEIGTIQPVTAIGQLLRHYPKILFHVDAVQSLGKVPLNLDEANVDMCTFSGHKINGLNGTGILYKRKGVQLFPLFHGGGQESNIRSGTENTAGNVSLVRALRLAKERETTVKQQLPILINKLRNGFEQMPGVHINSPTDGAAPHIMHVSVPGIKPETMIHALYEKGFVISTQSACSSKASDKSRVLTACGKAEPIASSGVRISLSHKTKDEEMDLFLQAFSDVTQALQKILKVDTHEL